MNFDQTLFIIGSGPSLANVPMHILKDKHTIAFNRSYIAFEDWGFNPTYYMAIDMRVLKNIQLDVNILIWHSGIKGFFIRDHDEFGFNTQDEIDHLQPNVKLIKLINGHGMGTRWTELKYCGDVAACSVQIAYLLGYRRAVLVGVDQRWKPREEGVFKSGPLWVADKNTDKNHFRPDYYGEGTEYSDPCPGAHLMAWRKVIDQAAGRIELISATPFSKLNEDVGYMPIEAFDNAVDNRAAAVV